MAITINVFLAQVDGLLSADNDELSQLRRQRLIKAALERYSHDAPDEVTEDVTGDAGNYYGVSNLTAWVEGFSRVVRIEYPAPTVASDEAPVYLEPEDYDDDYWDGSTRYIYLPNHAPAATEAMRIRHTAPYDWSASGTTTAVNQVAHGFDVNDYVYLDPDDSTWYEATDARIATHIVTVDTDDDNFTAALLQASPPVQDFFAICNLAAGLCAQAISDKYSRTSDSVISADSVDHLSRADQWSRRARELIGLYEEHLGLGGDDGAMVQAAGEFVDWDTMPSGNRQYLFHGDR